MSTNISEGLPAKKKAAPVVSAPKGGDKPDAKKGGTAENSGKRIRQAVYDIRYRARREDIDLKQAFSQYMSNTSMDQKDRAEVRAKLFGKGGGVSEQYIGASDDWALESFSKAFTSVFEHHQKDKDGNTIPHEDEFVTEYEKKLSEEKARKYKVRVTDPKSEKSYVRYADREKITALRGKGLKVEMTEYGEPYEGEKKKGEQTAKALGGGKKGKLDPVGKEDGDVNNDGKKDGTDKYLMNRRKAIGKAMAKEEVEQLDELSSDTLKSYIKKRKEKIARGKQGIDRATDQMIEKDTIGRTVKKPKGTYDIKQYKGKKGTIEYQKDEDKNQNEEYLADGTTSTEPTGKKINPKNVDNYKSGAVQIAPVDEADPQNGYGVKEEVEKKDNRANYAYINFMKNKLRAGMGIKNPMIMVDPDKAKEKFEKMATSITASTGEDEKEDACEQLDKKVNIPGFNNRGRGGNTGNIKVEPKALQVYRHARDVGNTVVGGLQAFGTMGRNMSLLKTQDARAERLRRNPQGIERVATGIADKLTGDKYDFDKKGTSKKPIIKSSYDPVDSKLSDISKTIMERGIGMRNRIKNETSTNIPTESNPSGGVRNQNDPTSYPSGAEIKDTPSTPSTGDTPSKPSTTSTPLKKPKPISVNSSYDPLSNKEILGISEKILKKNFNLGEEGYDVARDEGRVKPSKDKKDATSYPPSEEMKRTQKKNKGPSAYEIVKKKYGKAVMDVDKKKKDKK